MESWVQRWRPRTNALCDFSTPPVESTAPATKNRCQVIRSAAPVTQNHLRKSTYLMLQNATPLRKSAPWPPNISDEHVSCTAPARPGEMHLCRSSSNVPRLPLFLEMLQNPHVLLTFDTVHNPLRLPRETRSERPKVVRTPSAFNILTWKCASRHSGVHFFDISTSKSRPKLVCFVHVHFKMCFAPQRHAILRHLNFQKWSERGVFCTFWLGNVLRATTACTCSTSQVPKVVRTWCVLCILTWKCAWCHNGVHFFNISTSKSGPSVVRLFCTFWLGNVLRATTACNFSSLLWPAGSAPAALASLLFDPPEPQIIGTRRQLARERKTRFSSSSEDGSRKR